MLSACSRLAAYFEEDSDIGETTDRSKPSERMNSVFNISAEEALRELPKFLRRVIPDVFRK